MLECKSYENNWEKYSLYVHGFWLPYLQLLMDKGTLKQDVITFKIGIDEVSYFGFVDKSGRAFGHGVAKGTDNNELYFSGTFKDNKPHGMLSVKFYDHRSIRI